MIPADKNGQGEWALWDKGKLIGYAAMAMVDGRMVLASRKPTLLKMKADAQVDGVTLLLNSGYRPYSEQVLLRKRYRKAFEDALTAKKIVFESKLNDEKFILTAKSSEFLPACAPPGWSNHQDGGAYDWKVKDDPATKDVDEGKAFGWLKQKAINYGMIRTVSSERWHWEFRAGTQYSAVPEAHESWKV